jgi:protoporphyrinogen oxidase
VSQTGEPVVILGAGVAGLAAALRVTQLHPGRAVTLIESAAHPGGLASGWRHEGFTADLGPHRIFTELPEIEALLPELVAKDQMMTVRRTSQMLLEGQLIDYPIRAAELLRLLGPVRMGFYGLSALLAKAHALAGRKAHTFQDIMRQAFGAGLSQLIVEPYARKVWKTEPEDLDPEVARVRVSAGNITKLLRQIMGRPEPKGQESALREFRYIRGGVHGLVSALRDRAEKAGAVIHLNQRVSGFEVDQASGRIRSVLTRQVTPAREYPSSQPLVTSSTAVLGAPGRKAAVDNGFGAEHSHAAGAVISTIPLPDLVYLAAPHLPDRAAAESIADGLPYLGLILVALILPRPRLTQNCWLYFPDEDLIFNRAYEPANFDPTMATGDRTLVVFEVTARWDSPLWMDPVERVVEQVRADASRTGLIQPGEPVQSFAIKVPYTYPLYTNGYKERLMDALGRLQALPNLLSTGRQGLYNHNNMDHSMLMGIRAAEILSRNPDRPADLWIGAITEFDQFRIVD